MLVRQNRYLDILIFLIFVMFQVFCWQQGNEGGLCRQPIIQLNSIWSNMMMVVMWVLLQMINIQPDLSSVLSDQSNTVNKRKVMSDAPR